MSVSSNRRDIFKCFLDLYDNKRVQFIKVTDNVERENLLKLYLSNNVSLPKERYKKFMECGDKKEFFLRQLSKSAHTWSVMLLNPFL